MGIKDWHRGDTFGVGQSVYGTGHRPLTLAASNLRFEVGASTGILGSETSPGMPGAEMRVVQNHQLR